jgi:uncharacterized membrane-anchored protein
LLTGILGFMALDRVRLVRTGCEIVLPIKPVDPRDLFKGDYARLGYDISTPAAGLLAPSLKEGRGVRRVFVTLEKGLDSVWRPVAVSAGRPAGLTDNQLVLAGRMDNPSRPRIAYGIERYFVPEGEGQKLEALGRTATLSAVVVVDGRGRAAIKGISHDGRMIYEEPLF